MAAHPCAAGISAFCRDSLTLNRVDCHLISNARRSAWPANAASASPSRINPGGAVRYSVACCTKNRSHQQNACGNNNPRGSHDVSWFAPARWATAITIIRCAPLSSIRPWRFPFRAGLVTGPRQSLNPEARMAVLRCACSARLGAKAGGTDLMVILEKYPQKSTDKMRGSGIPDAQQQPSGVKELAVSILEHRV